jgi:hypothetical protein
MYPLWESWYAHCDVTLNCPFNCNYCSRHVRHLRDDQKRAMTLEEFQKAVDSYEGWPNRIGIMGGEPLLYPDFESMCDILRKAFPREQLGIFVSHIPKYEKLKPLIDRTFANIAVNPHSDEQKKVCKHQPLTLSIGEVVQSKETQERIIDSCWAQKTWCPTVTTKGAFFCELAAGFDRMLDGPGGWPVEKGWWLKTPNHPDFVEQRNRWCHICGMTTPAVRETLDAKKTRISPKLHKLMQEHNLKRIDPDHIIIYDTCLDDEGIKDVSKGWEPGHFRQDIRPD